MKVDRGEKYLNQEGELTVVEIRLIRRLWNTVIIMAIIILCLMIALTINWIQGII